MAFSLHTCAQVVQLQAPKKKEEDSNECGGWWLGNGRRWHIVERAPHLHSFWQF